MSQKTKTIPQNTPFRRFESCVPVKGASRSLICDLQRGNVKFIPSVLFEILEEYDGQTIATIKKAYENKYDPIIDEYFSFLLNQEFIFFTKSPELFPPMQMEWDLPNTISNAIIDIGENGTLDWDSILGQLSELGCQHIQIRSFYSKPISFFDNFLQILKEKNISSAILLLKYQDGFNSQVFQGLKNNYPKLFSITCHSSPMVETFPNEQIFFLSDCIDNSSHCGIISSDYFVVNIKAFTESIKHNNCLNRKIAVDSEGRIKNCPSMQQSFGNIAETSFNEALNHPEFKKHWNISKDTIHVCKDCEFRYICTDCRAFVEDPDDLFSKPLKCGYNPYEGKWTNWSENPLKQKTAEHYGLVPIQ